jgi:hypothetical protein
MVGVLRRNDVGPVPVRNGPSYLVRPRQGDNTMKFNDWSKERIRSGVKRLTSRKKPHYNDPDVEYIVGPLPWKFIREYLCREEGADSPEELQEVIDKIFARRGYPVADDENFYVHVLKGAKKK